MSTASRTGVMLVSFTLASVSAKTTVQMNFWGVSLFVPVQRNSCFQFKKRARRRDSRQGMVVGVGRLALMEPAKETMEKRGHSGTSFSLAHFLN